MYCTFRADLSKVSLVDGMEFKKIINERFRIYCYKAVQHIHKVLTKTHTFTEPGCVKEIS